GTGGSSCGYESGDGNARQVTVRSHYDGDDAGAKVRPRGQRLCCEIDGSFPSATARQRQSRATCQEPDRRRPPTLSRLAPSVALESRREPSFDEPGGSYLRAA